MEGWHLNPRLCRAWLCTAEHVQLSCYMRLLLAAAATPCGALSSLTPCKPALTFLRRSGNRSPLWLFWALPNWSLPKLSFTYGQIEPTQCRLTMPIPASCPAALFSALGGLTHATFAVGPAQSAGSLLFQCATSLPLLSALPTLFLPPLSTHLCPCSSTPSTMQSFAVRRRSGTTPRPFILPTNLAGMLPPPPA